MLQLGGREDRPIGSRLPEALELLTPRQRLLCDHLLPRWHRLLWLLLEVSGMIRAAADLLKC